MPGSARIFNFGFGPNRACQKSIEPSGLGLRARLVSIPTSTSLAVYPVLVLLGPALGGALLLHDVVGEHGGGHEVVCAHLPPGGEGARARELQTRVRVVAHGVPLAPRPDVSAREIYTVQNAIMLLLWYRYN